VAAPAPAASPPAPSVEASPDARATLPTPAPELTLAGGTNALAHGDYAAAIAAYEAEVARGHVNGHLFYNLGIAYYRAGFPGASAAAFLGARRYLPRDPDVAANLRLALAKGRDRLDPERAPSFAAHTAALVRWLSPREAAWSAAILTFLVCALLAASDLIPRLRPLRPVATMGLFVPVAAVAFAALKAYSPDAWGAVVTKEAKVHSGPSERDGVLFVLGDAAPVLVRTAPRDGFMRIELSDGKRGWILAKDVKVFGERS
jgi:hypothetical protein